MPWTQPLTREQIVEAPTVVHFDQHVEVPQILTAEAIVQVSPREYTRLEFQRWCVEALTQVPSPHVQFMDKVVIPFRRRRISASQLCCGDASPSAELRSRRN